jgi:penicillin-binding protein 1A
MKKRFKQLLIGICSVGILIFLGLVVYIFSLSSNLPDVAILKNYAPALSSKIYARNGEVLLETGKEKRELIDFKDIPPQIINSFLSAEDSGFYEHSGVDITGVIRAAFANLKAGRVVQGGSTITQQVAKSLLLSNERSIQRKIKDFILAIKIEQSFTKEEILYLYLNQVYLGGGFYGVKSAVRGYFDKDISAVTLAESALLAGLLVAPGKYSPYINPIYAKKRQLYVLERLYLNQKISKEEYEFAKSERIKLQKRGTSSFKAPYFTDWIRQRVIELVGEEPFLTQGFEVQTTLDWELQEIAIKAIKEGVRELDKRQGYRGVLNEDFRGQKAEKIIEFHRELLKKTSNFTWFDIQGELLDELDLDEEKSLSYKEEIKKHFVDDDILTKSLKTDAFISLNPENTLMRIDLESNYKSVVVGVNRLQEIIVVDLGGIRGVIPQSEFRWAHKRNILDTPLYHPPVENPHNVVKVGDVVLIRPLALKPLPLTKLVDSDYLKLNLSSEVKEYLATSSFLKVSLEQDILVQSGLVAMHPGTGEILSLVGGVDFEKSQFNRALQAKRQPGSAFKPFIYAKALEEGMTASSILFDTPQALSGVDQMVDWKPRNYDGEFLGPITFRKSLENSRNVPTIKLLQRVGVNKLQVFLNRIGIKLEREIDLSLALGSFGMNLLDMVSSYSIFPSGGQKISPKSIVSIKNAFGDEFFITEISDKSDIVAQVVESGQIDSENKENKEDQVEQPRIDYVKDLKGDQVYDQRLAFIMSELLRGVIRNGTGAGARELGGNLGGKTGTTNNYVDAWFVGFSEQITAGVWTGFDDNSTLGYAETGAKAALPIWKTFMSKTLEKYGKTEPRAPKGIVNVLINKESGKKATEGEGSGLVFREFFVEGSEPGGQFDFNKRFDDLGIIDDDDYFSSQE